MMSEVKKILCLLCPEGTAFRNNIGLGLHIAGGHKDLYEKIVISSNCQTFFCNVCKELKTSRLYKLMNHVYTYHSDKSKRNATEPLMERAEIINQNNALIESNIKQPKKPLGLQQKGFRKYYVKAHGANAFSCELCPYEGFAESNIAAHIKCHTESVEGHRCSKCGFCSAERSEVVRHLKLHNDANKGKLYDCPWCEYKHTSRVAQQQHISRHTQSKKITTNLMCTQCNYSVPHLRIMKYHLKNHHRQEADSTQQDDHSQGNAPIRLRVAVNRSVGSGEMQCSVTTSSGGDGGGAGAGAGGESPVQCSSSNVPNVQTPPQRQCRHPSSASSSDGGSAGVAGNDTMFNCPFCLVKSNDAGMLYDHVVWGHDNDMGLNPVQQEMRRMRVNRYLANVDPNLGCIMNTEDRAAPAPAPAATASSHQSTMGAAVNNSAAHVATAANHPPPPPPTNAVAAGIHPDLAAARSLADPPPNQKTSIHDFPAWYHP